MGVERRRRDALVPEQPLQEEQIDAIFKKERRRGMAQHVRRHAAREAGALREGAQLASRLLQRVG